MSVCVTTELFFRVFLSLYLRLVVVVVQKIEVWGGFLSFLWLPQRRWNKYIFFRGVKGENKKKIFEQLIGEKQNLTNKIGEGQKS